MATASVLYHRPGRGGSGRARGSPPPARQVEDRIKALKATGADYLPFHSFKANAAWLELALAAHDVTVWAQLLTLDGQHRLSKPKRLRYRNADLAVMPTSGRNLPQIGVIAASEVGMIAAC